MLLCKPYCAKRMRICFGEIWQQPQKVVAPAAAPAAPNSLGVWRRFYRSEHTHSSAPAMIFTPGFEKQVCTSAPDLDTVMYTSPERNNRELGWVCKAKLAAHECTGNLEWRHLVSAYAGDKISPAFFAQLFHPLKDETLTQVYRLNFATALNIAHRILPMCNEPQHIGGY